MTLQFVNIDPFHNGDNAARDCGLAAGLGFDGVRISEEFGWANWDSSLDVFCAAAENSNLFIMQTCQPEDHIMPSTAKEIADYAFKFAYCATKPRVKFIGVGNEWNGYGLSNNYDPVLAADIVLACLQACANLGSELMHGKFVVTPEVCPGSGVMRNDVWPKYSEPLSWFQAMVLAQPSILTYPHIAIGWHPYIDPHYPADYAANWNTCLKSKLASEWLVGKAGRRLPFVFGEYGIPIRRDGLIHPQAVDTETQQQDAYLDYQRAFRKFKKQGMNIKASGWYQLMDTDMLNTSDWAACTGFLDVDQTERAICDSVREVNG